VAGAQAVRIGDRQPERACHRDPDRIGEQERKHPCTGLGWGDRSGDNRGAQPARCRATEREPGPSGGDRSFGEDPRLRRRAAFAIPALYEALEQRSVDYAIRLPANQVLERAIEDLLTRPRGRPSRAPLVRFRSLQYQAASWDRPRRVIAKVEHHLGELFPRVGFIVTTLTGTNRAVVHFYNQRGTAEQ
jgi:hypothetical protein